jgi:hypothetical protein
MKKQLAFLLLILGLTIEVRGQKTKFETEEWPQILSKSKKTNKPIFALLYDKASTNLDSLKKAIFTDKTLALYLNKHFVLTQKEAQKDHITWQASEYPAFLFFNANNEEIIRYEGISKFDYLLEDFQYALQISNQPTLEGLEKKYRDGDRTSANLKLLLEKRYLANTNRLDNDYLLEDYFNANLTENANTPENRELVWKNAKSVRFGSNAFLFFKTYTTDFVRDYYKEGEVSEIILLNQFKSYIAYCDFLRALETQAEIDEKLKIFKDHLAINADWFEDPEQLIFKHLGSIPDKSKLCSLAVSYLENRYPLAENLASWGKKFNKIKQSKENAYDTAVKDSLIAADITKAYIVEKEMNKYFSEDLNNAAWQIYKNCEDSNQINNALQWAKIAIDLHPTYYKLDTYAHLLHKKGDKQRAVWEQFRALRMYDFYETTTVESDIKKDYLAFSSDYNLPQIRPMAIDKPTLENHLWHYQHYNMVLDYPKILSFMPASLFNYFKKEEMQSSLEMSFNSREIFVNLDDLAIKIPNDIYFENEIGYTKLKMTMTTQIGLEKLLATTEDKNLLLQTITQNYHTMYGEGNCTFDKETATFSIKMENEVFAIGEKNQETWKFINNEKNMARIIEKIIPVSVQEKLH